MHEKWIVIPPMKSQDHRAEDTAAREKPILRADAARNRASILAAASQIFDEHGFDVSMSKIADAAGVGRTTLLRNFPTRMELATALFEQVMVDMRAMVASQTGKPDDFVALLDLKLEFYIRHGGITEAFHKATAYSKEFTEERNEVAHLLLKAAQGGIKSGALRQDLTVDTFIILQKALSGALRSGSNKVQRRETARILKSILLDGVRNRSASGE